MTSEHDEHYPSPLSERYASREMASLFSNQAKFRTWRRLWLVLLEAERELGLPITDEQVAEVRKHQDDIDLDRVAELERATRHDVMAHLRQLGEQCPKARPDPPPRRDLRLPHRQHRPAADARRARHPRAPPRLDRARRWPPSPAPSAPPRRSATPTSSRPS